MKKTKRNLIHPRDELVEAMERIYRYRMTTTSGGNLSIKDTEDNVWITPARIDKANLKPEDIVCIHKDGAIDGRHKPSSEFPFHNQIYKARPDIRAIVHAHPVALVAFSICREVPDTTLFPKAFQVCGKAGFATYEIPGSEALGKRISDTFAEGYNCVILENHGVVIGGTTLKEAFERFETLEFTAKIIIKSRVVGKPTFLTGQQLNMAESMDLDMEPFNPGEATSEERSLRKEIVNFVRRGYRQRLMTSTKGTFSARLNADSFLITSFEIDRKDLDLDDITLISKGRCEVGKEPSKAVRIHEYIYKKHPGVKAIINASPVNATAFSISGKNVESRTIPESYLFLKDVVPISYEMLYRDHEKISDLISPLNPVGIIENDGVIVLGTSVFDAFDRLEVLENTAEALINSHFVGTVHSMSDESIDDLIAAFKLDTKPIY